MSWLLKQNYPNNKKKGMKSVKFILESPEVGLAEINAKSSLENTNNLNGFQLIIFFYLHNTQKYFERPLLSTSFYITFIKTNPGE